MYTLLQSLRCDCPRVVDDVEDDDEVQEELNWSRRRRHEHGPVVDPSSSALLQRLEPRVVPSDVTTYTSETRLRSNTVRDRPTNRIFEMTSVEDKSEATEETTAESDDDDEDALRASADLTGRWSVVGIDDAWKEAYADYLSAQKYPASRRSTALSAVHRAREEILQTNERVFSRRTDPAAGTLVLEFAGTDEFRTTLPNGENVSVQGWWEREGTVHRCRIAGSDLGDWDERRWLEDEGRTLVRRTDFYSRGGSPKVSVQWRFRRSLEGSCLSKSSTW